MHKIHVVKSSVVNITTCSLLLKYCGNSIFTGDADDVAQNIFEYSHLCLYCLLNLIKLLQDCEIIMSGARIFAV